LPGRQNIIVTRNTGYHVGAEVPKNSSLNIVHNLTEALAIVDCTADEVMIIGGATLFKEALPKTDVLYLTYIHAEFPGDTFFPELDKTEWSETWREDHEADDKNPCSYSFVRLEKKY